VYEHQGRVALTGAGAYHAGEIRGGLLGAERVQLEASQRLSCRQRTLALLLTPRTGSPRQGPPFYETDSVNSSRSP
jgi:hypothetical protein